MENNNCHIMKNKKLIRFVESFILLPILTTMPGAPVGSTVGSISGAMMSIVNTPVAAFSQKLNTEQNVVVDPEVLAREKKAEAIDKYFETRSMPLAGHGMTMILEAEKNGISDWRLLPAIAVRESTGGKHECKRVENNAFGWGSCKIGFDSHEVAIAIVAKNLGGNNPKTAHHYDNKGIKEILRAYNPPSVVPKYAEQVMSIMDAIGDVDLASTTTETANTVAINK
jgi:hypothetical protein